MGSAAVSAPAAAQAAKVGGALDGLGIKHYTDGEGALDSAALKGKVTVINFWATWCAACKVELVEMEGQLKQQLADKAFQAAFVSLDKDPEKAAQWLKGNMKEPDVFVKRLYVDPKFETADRLQVDSFPMTIVVGKDGKVAHVQRGFKEGEGSTERIAKLASELLKVAH